MSYFNEERKKWAMDDLHTIHECADRAEIRHALFVGFGLCLGIVRERDFIGHDNDIDMCVLSERIEKEQEEAYFNYLVEKDMFYARMRVTRRDDTCRFTWFSLRKRSDHSKFCHWFFFPWSGYYWHTKAGLWVTNKKFDTKYKFNQEYDALMKGVPQEYIPGLTAIDFNGLAMQVPEKTGACLDFWYPGWYLPKKGGASAKKIVATVKDWHDKRTWKVYA